MEEIACHRLYWSEAEVVQITFVVQSTYTNAIEQLLLKWSGCDCNISMYDVIGFYYGHVTMFWNLISTANFLVVEVTVIVGVLINYECIIANSQLTYFNVSRRESLTSTISSIPRSPSELPQRLIRKEHNAICKVVQVTFRTQSHQIICLENVEWMIGHATYYIVIRIHKHGYYCWI